MCNAKGVDVVTNPQKNLHYGYKYKVVKPQRRIIIAVLHLDNMHKWIVNNATFKLLKRTVIKSYACCDIPTSALN